MARKHGLKDRARELRRKSTDAEQRLWNCLRNRQLGGAKFRRQVPIDRYVADFLCQDSRLVVEADGGQHSEERDAARTAYLEAQGFRVIRFWNHDILENIDGVLDRIAEEMAKPPHPPQSDD